MIMFTPIPRPHGASRAEHGDRFSAHVLQSGHSQRKSRECPGRGCGGAETKGVSWRETWAETGPRLGAKRWMASARAAPRVRGRRRAKPVALHLLHVLCKLEPLACGLLERPFFRGVVRSRGPELIVRTHLAISVCSRFHLLSRRCAWRSGPIRVAAR